MLDGPQATEGERMPRKANLNAQGSAKLSLTLSLEAADELRALAEGQHLTLAELVRRAVGLYKFATALGDDEELCIRDRQTKEVIGVAWIVA